MNHLLTTTKILLNLFSKPKTKIERPLDYQKSLKKVNQDYITLLGCTVEVLPDGRYKAFDQVVNSIYEAAKAVRDWKFKHEQLMIKEI